MFNSIKIFFELFINILTNFINRIAVWIIEHIFPTTTAYIILRIIRFLFPFIVYLIIKNFRKLEIIII